MKWHRNPRLLLALAAVLALSASIPAAIVEAQTADAEPAAIFGSTGTTVHIKGGNFGTSTPSVNFVGHNGVSAPAGSVSVGSATTINATAPNINQIDSATSNPAVTDPVSVQLTTSGGTPAIDATVAGARFYYGPVITGLSHDFGQASTSSTTHTLVIKGGNFSGGAPVVNFVASGGTGASAPATVVGTNSAATAVTVQIPPSPGPDPVQVQLTIPGSTNIHHITPTLTALYATPSAGNFYYNPVINSLNKDFALWSTSSSTKKVVIKGGNFGTSGTQVTASFAGISFTPTVSHGATAVTVSTPPQPSSPPSDPVAISLSVNGTPAMTASSTANRAYFGPVVNSLSKNTGTTGTAVVIKGGNFGTTTSSVQVTFGSGLPITPSSVTPTTIHVAAPTSPQADPVPITVSINGSGVPVPLSGANNFYYGPVINSVK